MSGDGGANIVSSASNSGGCIRYVKAGLLYLLLAPVGGWYVYLYHLLADTGCEVVILSA
jgi:hypothetical protein